MSPLPRNARTLLTVTAWTVALLLSLEILLQAGAWWVKEHSWRAKNQWLTGHLRVLTLGDSNTYGLYLPAEDSYPAQLETLWNGRHPALPIEVINLGYPGTNSFRLLANLPELLDTFQPDMVLIMIGFNDFWTPVEIPVTVQELPLLKKLQYHSRLYQVFYMWRQKQQLQYTVDSGQRMLGGLSGVEFTAEETAYIENAAGLTLSEYEQLPPHARTAVSKKMETAIQSVLEKRKQEAGPQDILNTVSYGDKVFSLGISAGTSAGNSKKMPDNIRAMMHILQQRNTPYFLLNYPTRFGYYPAANKKINTLAAETAAPFINLQDVFHPDCQVKPEHCPELLFYDAHATAKGNQLIAEKVASELARYLTVSGP